MTPAAALQLLRDGNHRFQQRRPEFSGVRETPQPPFAALLGCVDARVPPELVFDQGLNDLYTARVAGNVLNDDILGGLELACTVGGCKIVVVLGHTDCAAIKAACADDLSGYMVGLTHKLQPALREAAGGAACDPEDADFVQRAAECNAHRVAQEVARSSAVLRQKKARGEIEIVGALFDVATGIVHFQVPSHP